MIQELIGVLSFSEFLGLGVCRWDTGLALLMCLAVVCKVFRQPKCGCLAIGSGSATAPRLFTIVV